tara:strand:+ start:416 stop:637 length:222 start_codon:yes stop_codon:yes gene_type:complete
MNESEMGVLFGGISAILASLIYFTKNVKESSCCGNKCTQVVIDTNGKVVRGTMRKSQLEGAIFPKTVPQTSTI